MPTNAKSCLLPNIFFYHKLSFSQVWSQNKIESIWYSSLIQFSSKKISKNLNGNYKLNRNKTKRRKNHNKTPTILHGAHVYKWKCLNSQRVIWLQTTSAIENCSTPERKTACRMMKINCVCERERDGKRIKK